MNALIVLSCATDSNYIDKALSLFKREQDMVFFLYLHKGEDLYGEQTHFNSLVRIKRSKGWTVAGAIEKGNPIDGIENIVDRIENTTVVVPKGDIPFQSLMTVSLEEALKKKMKVRIVSIHAAENGS